MTNDFNWTLVLTHFGTLQYHWFKLYSKYCTLLFCNVIAIQKPKMFREIILITWITSNWRFQYESNIASQLELVLYRDIESINYSWTKLLVLFFITIHTNRYKMVMYKMVISMSIVWYYKKVTIWIACNCLITEKKNNHWFWDNCTILECRTCIYR